MKNLELECFNCGDKITLKLNDKEFEYFQRNGSLIKGSKAYQDLFEGFGWVLQQNPYCDLCKYDNSEVYREG